VNALSAVQDLARVFDGRGAGSLWRRPRADLSDADGGLVGLLLSIELVCGVERIEEILEKLEPDAEARGPGTGLSDGSDEDARGVGDRRTDAELRSELENARGTWRNTSVRAAQRPRLGRFVDARDQTPEPKQAAWLDAISRELATRAAFGRLHAVRLAAARRHQKKVLGELASSDSGVPPLPAGDRLWVLGLAWIQTRLDVGVFESGGLDEPSPDQCTAEREFCAWLGLSTDEQARLSEFRDAWSALLDALRVLSLAVGTRRPGSSHHQRWFQLLGEFHRAPGPLGGKGRSLAELLEAMMAPAATALPWKARWKVGAVNRRLSERQRRGLPVATWQDLLERLLLGGSVYLTPLDLPVSGDWKTPSDSEWAHPGVARVRKSWLPARLLASSARLIEAGVLPGLTGGDPVEDGPGCMRLLSAAIHRLARDPELLRPLVRLDLETSPPRFVEAGSGGGKSGSAASGWPLDIVQALRLGHKDIQLGDAALERWVQVLVLHLARDQVGNLVEQSLPSLKPHLGPFFAKVAPLQASLPKGSLHAGGARLSGFHLFLRTTWPWAVDVDVGWSPTDGVRGNSAHLSQLNDALRRFHQERYPACKLAHELGDRLLNALLAQQLRTSERLGTVLESVETGVSTMRSATAEELRAYLFAPEPPAFFAPCRSLEQARLRVQNFVAVPAHLMDPRDVERFMAELAKGRPPKRCSWPITENPNRGTVISFWSVRARERWVRFPPI
jgi:hypothetical protein